MRRFWWLFPVVPVILLLAAMATRAVLADALVRNKPPRPMSEANFARLLEELTTLRDAGLHGACVVTRDAGPLLNPIAGLELTNNPAPWWAEPEVNAALNEGDSYWLDHVDDAPTGDLSLTTALLAYDGWEVANAPRVRAVLDGSAVVPAFEAPMPRLVPVLTLAKLRLLDGVRRDDLAAAILEVDHLASLIACDESLVSAVVAATVRALVPDVVEVARRRGAQIPDSWVAPPAGREDMVRRVTFGLSAVYLGHAPPDSISRVGQLRREGQALPGECAALGEALPQWSFYQYLLGDPWPGELDHLAPMRGLTAALEASPCRLVLGRAYLANPAWNARAFEVEDGSSLVRLPYLRDLNFYLFRAVAAPDYDLYDREPGAG